MTSPESAVNTRRNTMLWALLAGVLVTTQPALGQDAVRLSGRRVAVYNLAGEVEVVRGMGTEVVVHVTRGGAEGDALGFDTREIDGRQVLIVRYPADEVRYAPTGRSRSSTTLSVREDGTWGGRQRGGERVRINSSGSGLEAHADLRIELPEGRGLSVFLGVGEARAGGLRSDLELDLGAGRVAVDDVVGDVSVDTGSGSVEVRGVQGEVLIDTGSGGIRVDNVRGPAVVLDTGSGSVDAADLTVDAVEVDTGSGSVTLVRIAAPDVLVDTGSGAVDVHLISNVERLEVDTGSGGVTLRLPAEVDAEFEADSGSGGVDIDFPIQVRSQRRNYLSGVLGAGRGRIVVDTGSGRIRLVRN